MKTTFEPAPNFEIISSELFCVKEAGYVLDFDNDRTHRNFTAALFWDDTDDAENRAHEEIDSFYDLSGARLCVCNGEMYAVGYIYGSNGYQPCIWQKIKKAEV